MKKTKKALVISSALATTAVCASLVAGATFALFTSEDKVDIAVTAGKVAVSASVDKESLELTSMATVQEGASWANGGTAGFNSKDELELTYITPGDGAAFNVIVKNESTVNVKYRISWTVTGELADALEVSSSVAKYGLWTDWTAPKTEDEKVKTVSVSVALPEEVGNEYQEKSAKISFAVEAVQANANVVDEAATVNGVNYATFAEALSAVQDGGSITLKQNEGSAEVQSVTIDKNISIIGNGEVAFENTHFVLANNAEVTFDKVNFEGDSYIDVASAGALNMTGCVANVAPTKINNNMRVAFIANWGESTHGLKLNLIGNTINAANDIVDASQTTSAIFLWAYLDDSVIANNIFGNENSRYGFFAAKFMNAMDGATIEISDNTVYGRDANYAFDAFIFGQNNSRDNEYTVISNRNTIDAVSEGENYFKAFAIGLSASDKNHTLTLIDNGTTLNGELLTLDDIDYDAPDCYFYVSVNGEVRLGGSLVEVSDGFAQDKNNANVYYVFNADGLKYLATVSRSLGAEGRDATVTLLSDIDLENKEWTPINSLYHCTFNGNGHTVYNITVTETAESAGLFGSLAMHSYVKNVNVENVTVNTAIFGGGVVGYTYGFIENCNAKNVTVTLGFTTLQSGALDDANNCGGIVGCTVSGYVKNCTVENATLSGYRDIGGIAGKLMLDESGRYADDPVLSGCTITNVKITVDQTRYEEYESGHRAANANSIVGSHLAGTVENNVGEAEITELGLN